MTKFELMNEADRLTTNSASDAITVDISSGNHEFGRCTRWLWCGSGGSVMVRMASGVVVQLDGLSSSQMLPISVSAVLSQGTYASSMLALF